MNKDEVIKKIGKYFDIQELVCKHIYNKWGDRSWMFLEQRFLESLLSIRRDILCAPMYCNNWESGGSFSQRGRRCNLCQLVRDATNKGSLYLTAHASGLAGDFTVSGMSAEEARKKIIANKHMLSYNIRLEGGVSWLHVDCYDDLSGEKIKVF